MKIGYGIQMYSLRDAVKEDMDCALKTVADMGYQYIEFAGFAGHSADEIRAMLDQYGLKCSGTHTGLPALTPETIEETIAYHKAIGCDSIIVPSMPMNTEEELEASIAGFMLLIVHSLSGMVPHQVHTPPANQVFLEICACISSISLKSDFLPW